MKKIGLLFSILFIFIIYHAWFSFGVSSSGDSGYYYPSVFNERINFLYAWMPERGNGMGGIYYPLLWSGLGVALPLFLFGQLFDSWSFIEKIAYYYPFLLVGFMSSFFLFQKLFPKNNFSFLSPFIFLTNTYILMVIGGGQLLIGLSYAISPFIIWKSMHLINKILEKKYSFRKDIFSSVLLGLVFSIQVLLDVRLLYITIFAIILYSLLGLFLHRCYKQSLQLLFFIFLLPLCIVSLLHSFWILPTILTHQNPIQQLNIVSSTQTVQFLSFATLENTLGFLHPNWYENIFGKVSFMQPIFLLLPIFAYISLLFLDKKNKDNRSYFENIYIIFFALLGLVGAFFAKGSMDPFGSIYLWLFIHFPGFNLFRDPTKWYLLIALSYTVLIPYTIEKIYSVIKESKK